MDLSELENISCDSLDKFNIREELWGRVNINQDDEGERGGIAENHQRVHYTELTLKYEYRRAFSESSLLDAMEAPGFDFKKGHCYCFISAGDVDSLSFLKAVLRQQNLSHLLCSTWCMSCQDVLQFREWIGKGKIEKMDFYVGEIFKSSYSYEFTLLNKLYEDFPNLGRFVMFRNHSKVFAGIGEKFAFAIQSSANINTNPRCEQTAVIIDEGLYEFYKNYYNGINSFKK